MKQSFAWWSFSMGVTAEDQRALLRAAADIGVQGVEMLPEALWPAARNAGLELVTIAGHDIERGFNDPALHSELQDRVGAAIESAAVSNIDRVIVFSGNRFGLDDPAAIAACAEGLAPTCRGRAARWCHAGVGNVEQQARPSRLPV